jgi:hypothetical protein
LIPYVPDVAGSLMSARFAVTIDLENRRDGCLGYMVRPLEAGVQLRGDVGTVIVTMWAEIDGTVRARLQHLPSGLTSYLQGNETIIAFGRALGLSIGG